MECVIDLEQVSKSYQIAGQLHQMLTDTTFSLSRGESCRVVPQPPEAALFLHNIISLLERPTSGAYYLDGDDVSRLSVDDAARLRLRKLGLLTRERGLVPTMSVLENVRLPYVMCDEPEVDMTAVEAESLRLLRACGLSVKQNWPCESLTEAEQCAAVMVREALKRPEVVLVYKFDEAGLVPRELLAEYLKRLQRQGSAILIFDDTAKDELHTDSTFFLTV